MACHRNTIIASLSALALAGASTLAMADGAGGGGSGYSPGEAANQYDPTKDYQAGVTALQAGNFDEADRALTRVSRAAPRDANVRFYLSVAKAGKNDLKGARTQYDQALRANRLHVLARRELAITLFKLGEKEDATDELETLKKRVVDCADTCKEAADLKAAVAAVEASLVQPAPQSSLSDQSLLFTSAAVGEQAYFDAVSMINERRYGDALVSLRQAESAFGPHPDVLTYIGFTYRKLGD